MKSKNLWLRFAGTLFGIVAILHLLRILTGIPVTVGDFLLPLWVNWLGMTATAFLCCWLWKITLSK